MHTRLVIPQARMVFNEFHVVMMALQTIGPRLRADGDPMLMTAGQRLGELYERLQPYQWPMRITEVRDDRMAALIDNALADADGHEALARFHWQMRQLAASLAALAGAGPDITALPHPRVPAASVSAAPAASAATDAAGTATAAGAMNPIVDAGVSGHDRAALAALKQLNVELLACEAAIGRTRLASFPIRHVIDAGSRCNLRCLTCHQSANQDLIHYDVADVPTAVLDPAILHASLVQIAGMGETLMSRATPALVQAYHAGGVYVELLNNGTMLARAQRLAEAVDMLSISIDGGTAETYDHIRRWGHFDRLIAAVRDLDAPTRRKVCFNFVVCRQNLFSCPDLVDEAAALGIGQVHFAEMNVPLSWHHRMALDVPDRRWFFDNLPIWRAKAVAAGVHVVANLIPPPASEPAPATSAATGDRPAGTATATATTLPRQSIQERLALVADVPIPEVPHRLSLRDACAGLAICDDIAFPPRMASHLRATTGDIEHNAPGGRRPLAAEVDEARAALHARIQQGTARLPHCLASYAQLLVNGDGSTRSCCSVQSQLATLHVHDFDEVRNSVPYVDLRTAHAADQAPRHECRDCHDPLRFFLLIDVLQALRDRGIDITRIARPADFPLPASLASHPLVQALGSNAGEPPPLWKTARRWVGTRVRPWLRRRPARPQPQSARATS